MNNLHRMVGGVLLGLTSLLGVAARAESIAERTRPLVYVIPIRNQIEPALLYVIRRGVSEAQSRQADALIFVMDTPGGRVDAAREIVFLIQNVRIPTYTFVEKDAFSAGAIIALATRNIYMAPGSVIGDALPVMITPFGGVQEVPEGLEEKQVSAVAALIRAAAEQGGHNKELAEAMVRRETEFRIDDRLIKPAGQLLTLTNVEAEERFGDPGEPLLSSGTVESLEQLLAHIGKADAELRVLQVSGAERVARYIAALGPLLLMLGLLGLYVESRTPGIGIPGALGAAALMLFFWGHHIAGLTGSEDVMIFALGLVLLLIEVLFIPDFGLIGIGGLVLMGTGLLMAMVQRMPGGPLVPELSRLQLPLLKLGIAFAGTVAGAILLGRYLPRTTVFHRLQLESATGRDRGFSAAADSSRLVGSLGRSLSSLRPSGTAVFEGVRRDVVSRGEFVEANHPIRIVEARGSRLVVEPEPETETPAT